MKKIITMIGISLISGLCWSHGVSVEDQLRMQQAGFFDYILLGGEHMLTGYDHLLFLFGVIFFLDNVKDILKFITAFTFGHSITLIGATLAGWQANYFLIDAVIALTVCYKAFENLDGFKRYFRSASPNLLMMVFGFGLIHGFGLSTRLQQLPLGQENIIVKAIAFNIGVELGQIVALVIMMLILAGWRKRQSFDVFSRVTNTVLLFAGGALFLMQLHSYQHSSFPDEFPLNTDDHHHAHEETAKASVLQSYPKRIFLNEKSKGEQNNE
ncbi:HupE/UreJ family protein [Teredinibacter haidensis]|uniref:HupE/UreJ family protein n=1 Tax=Teredinibacter haidensis TaxID=2731755 RepID=UPI0009488B88|nr:HupE/UreJ family protein [Teredinibacter haidensis]